MLQCGGGGGGEVAIDSPWLRRATGAALGVRWADCGVARRLGDGAAGGAAAGCLLAVCGDTRLALKDSLLAGFNASAGGGLAALLCAFDRAQLTLQRTQLLQNQAINTTIMLMDRAHVVIADSTLDGNSISSGGSGSVRVGGCVGAASAPPAVHSSPKRGCLLL